MILSKAGVHPHIRSVCFRILFLVSNTLSGHESRSWRDTLLPREGLLTQFLGSNLLVEACSVVRNPERIEVQLPSNITPDLKYPHQQWWESTIRHSLPQYNGKIIVEPRHVHVFAGM